MYEQDPDKTECELSPETLLSHYFLSLQQTKNVIAQTAFSIQGN